MTVLARVSCGTDVGIFQLPEMPTDNTNIEIQQGSLKIVLRGNPKELVGKTLRVLTDGNVSVSGNIVPALLGRIV